MEGQVVEKGQSKKGTEFIIRYLKREDVKGMWEYINRLSKERTYVRFQGEEISLEDEEKYIRTKLDEISKDKSVVLLLIVNNKVQGICNADLQDKTENHVAGLGLSIDQSIRGQGLGEKLLNAAIKQAKKKFKGLKIIRLDVKQPNSVAISLYKKLGFEQYGHLPKGTVHRGEFVDHVLMYKIV